MLAIGGVRGMQAGVEGFRSGARWAAGSPRLDLHSIARWAPEMALAANTLPPPLKVSKAGSMHTWACQAALCCAVLCCANMGGSCTILSASWLPLLFGCSPKRSPCLPPTPLLLAMCTGARCALLRFLRGRAGC